MDSGLSYNRCEVTHNCGLLIKHHLLINQSVLACISVRITNICSGCAGDSSSKRRRYHNSRGASGPHSSLRRSLCRSSASVCLVKNTSKTQKERQLAIAYASSSCAFVVWATSFFTLPVHRYYFHTCIRCKHALGLCFLLFCFFNNVRPSPVQLLCVPVWWQLLPV